MDAGPPLGTIASLWRYPIKSLKAESLERALVGLEGLEGDRRRALFVTSADHARTAKTFRGKENNRLHLMKTSADGVAVAAAAGVGVELRNDGPFFDSRPVSLLFDRWLGEVEALLGTALDPLRYRPNLFARANGSIPSERELVGARLQIGEARLRVVEPNLRCVTTTYDVQTGEPNPEILRALAQHRENQMGVYCIVETPGGIAIGDAIVAML